MNSTPQATTPVVVTLTDCSKEDAGTVFRVLSESFASDRAADDTPQDVSGTHTTVWTSTFEVSGTGAAEGPARLAAAVQAEVQGGYWAVDRLRETLASAFEVAELGMAAGDQEKEIDLRLESRSG